MYNKKIQLTLYLYTHYPVMQFAYAYAYVCSATSNWYPGHHGVTTIYNLHHPGCC